MTEVPKIVADRLRAAKPLALQQATSSEPRGSALAHPDANLLTAFAEQALSATERDGVLNHLAACGDCRDVMALALPQVDFVPTPVTAEEETLPATTVSTLSQRRWLKSFAWPNLRWAALAAGVAVIAAVLVTRPGPPNQAKLPAVPQATTVAPLGPTPQVASSSDNSAATLAKAQPAPPTPELRSRKKATAGRALPPTAQAMLLAGNKNLSSSNNLPSPAAIPAAGSGFGTRDATTEQVEVSRAVVAPQTAPTVEDNLMAKNDAPAIEKAKAPLQGIDTQGTATNEQQKAVIAPAPSQAPSRARSATSFATLASTAKQAAHNAAWMISAGSLQRSLDGGQTWQSAVHADQPLLCYATHDQDVWTGGKAGALFHSPDGGVTWVHVPPSIAGQPLTADITHIDVRGRAEIVISINANVAWSTSDGGKTWEKK